MTEHLDKLDDIDPYPDLDLHTIRQEALKQARQELQHEHPDPNPGRNPFDLAAFVDTLETQNWTRHRHDGYVYRGKESPNYALRLTGRNLEAWRNGNLIATYPLTRRQAKRLKRAAKASNRKKERQDRTEAKAAKKAADEAKAEAERQKTVYLQARKERLLAEFIGYNVGPVTGPWTDLSAEFEANGWKRESHNYVSQDVIVVWSKPAYVSAVLRGTIVMRHLLPTDLSAGAPPTAHDIKEIRKIAAASPGLPESTRADVFQSWGGAVWLA